MYKKILAIASLIGIGIAGRLLPHVPNATPITAITFAAQKHVGRVWSFIVPLSAMVISDAFVGFYDWKILISVYSSFILIGFISQWVKKHTSPLAITALTMAASVTFFLVTNFAVWMFSPWYEKSLSGLFYCYTLGLPFLRSMVLGDLFYTFVLLGILATSTISLKKAREFLTKSPVDIPLHVGANR